VLIGYNMYKKLEGSRAVRKRLKAAVKKSRAPGYPGDQIL